MLTASVALPPIPRPFRFQHMWVHHKNFLPMVRDCWSVPVHGSPILILMKKLKRLKIYLRQWNRDVFSKVFEELDAATTSLDEIQHTIAIRGDSNALFDQEMNATVHVNELYLNARHSLSNVIESLG